ncbi:unnamed protein product [Allacma fusca]|nr:unnamed protein product [Allacma fusca]
MEIDDSSLPSLVLPKEEKFDFEEDVDKKYEPPRRGRTRSLTKKPADKADIKAKLERSRQSARECRARKKLRYQYLEEIILETEKAIFALRREFEVLKLWAKELDEGRCPEQLLQYRASVAGIDKNDGHDPSQFQMMQQNSSSPGSSFGAGSLSPNASGLSISPGDGGGPMNPYMGMGNRLSMLSHSLSPS